MVLDWDVLHWLLKSWKYEDLTQWRLILSVRLDVVYFVENWKLKIIKKKFSGHYSLMKNTVHLPWCTVHILWTVHQALELLKKKPKRRLCENIDTIQMKLKTQILLHLDIKFHSTDKKEKRNGDEFGVQSKVKEMLFIN